MLHDINDIMFRPEDVRPRTGLLSDEEDTPEEEEEEEEGEDASEEEEEEEVKALIDNIAAIIHENEVRENRYTRINDTANAVAYLQDTGWLAHLSLTDQYNFVKKIIKRRRLERRGDRMDEGLRRRGLRTRDEARQFLDADKGWMTKILHSWSDTFRDYGQSCKKTYFAPWQGENPAECNMGENPAECNMTTSLSVCCKLTKYHKGPCPGPNYRQVPTYPLWLMSWAKPPKMQPIDELMREGRVFSDGSHQVWVQLTETEFKDSFSGGEAIYEYMKKDLLRWVDPGTPQHMQHMRPFREYRPCTVTEDVTEDTDAGAENFYIEEPDGADDEMSDGADDEMSDGAHGAGGGTRAQKKHKPKHKHKTKTKSKSKCKTKTKTKTKSKCKRKTKPKSKTKTKTKNRNH
jgi:hypothetical protein